MMIRVGTIPYTSSWLVGYTTSCFNGAYVDLRNHIENDVKTVASIQAIVRGYLVHDELDYLRHTDEQPRFDENQE